jgi:hypothetical protein
VLKVLIPGHSLGSWSMSTRLIRSRLRWQVKVTLPNDQAMLIRRWSTSRGLSAGSLVRSILKARLRLVTGGVDSGQALARPKRDASSRSAIGMKSTIHVWLSQEDYLLMRKLATGLDVTCSEVLKWVVGHYVSSHQGSFQTDGRTDGRTLNHQLDEENRRLAAWRLRASLRRGPRHSMSPPTMAAIATTPRAVSNGHGQPSAFAMTRSKAFWRSGYAAGP